MKVYSTSCAMCFIIVTSVLVVTLSGQVVSSILASHAGWPQFESQQKWNFSALYTLDVLANSSFVRTI